jgi:integrase/recombinase XerD
MKETTISIIKHIPLFLDYCKEIGLSDKTQENYKRYLNKFTKWLEYKKLQDILPHQLTSDYIWDYRLYLSRHSDPITGKNLKKSTQNYYLIALRALLGYFSSKDIVCLPINRITLLGGLKAEKTAKFLNLEQIKELLLAPNIN